MPQSESIKDQKKILLAVTGSIAAYKIASLVRLLIKSDYEIRVLMTPSATEFISPLTLATLSKNEVHTNIIDHESWNNHVALGLWADIMVIAPCTANTLGKLANGIADNMVIASYLSAKCPICIAPAMDLDMWQHPSTKQNIDRLKSYGNHIIQVNHGELASGLIGEGRMAEPEEILQYIKSIINQSKSLDLKDKKVLITAGPTYEKIDPVRFIGNPSSGKMGVALALECLQRGAEVKLVLGPSSIKVPIHHKLSVTTITSAEEMLSNCMEYHKDVDIVIFAAAVADYTPLKVAEHKIKKKEGNLNIELKRTQDIAAVLGRQKKSQIHIGFALETNNLIENAKEKIKKKNFDLIVLNTINISGAGFKSDTNKVWIIHKNEQILEYSLKSKTKVAQDIVNQVIPYTT